MDNQMLGLIGIGVVAYLVLKNKEEDKVVPATPPTPPLPPTPPAVPGCMDPAALNYNPTATIGDASCVYPVSGCMDQNASNYNPTATTACS